MVRRVRGPKEPGPAGWSGPLGLGQGLALQGDVGLDRAEEEAAGQPLGGEWMNEFDHRAKL